jgi:hypothetical protein
MIDCWKPTPTTLQILKTANHAYTNYTNMLFNTTESYHSDQQWLPPRNLHCDHDNLTDDANG